MLVAFLDCGIVMEIVMTRTIEIGLDGDYLYASGTSNDLASRSTCAFWGPASAI